MIDAIWKWLQQNENHAVIFGLIWTVAAGIGISFLNLAVRRAVLRNVTAIEERHRIRSRLGWLSAVAFFVVTGLIWAGFLSDMNLSTFLGIVGAGVALSLQETLLCLAGWLLIIIRKPFDIGDRVEIDGRIGDVIDIRVFQTTLLEVGNWVGADQSTGRLLVVPNSMVFRHPVYNYTEGFPFLWNEISSIVTFESDWEQAKGIMLDQALEEGERIREEMSRQIKAMQGKYAIHFERLTPIVYTSIADNGVRLTLRYLTPARQRRATSHRIAENILKEFIKHRRIDFAYPTTRWFSNPTEGKPEAGGPPEPVPDAAPSSDSNISST